MVRWRFPRCCEPISAWRSSPESANSIAGHPRPGDGDRHRLRRRIRSERDSGTQVTVGRYPNAIQDLDRFPALVVEAIAQQLDLVGEPQVTRPALGIGPAARLELVHRLVPAGGQARDVLAVQYLIPNDGTSFYLSLASIADNRALVEEFDLAVQAARRGSP